MARSKVFTVKVLVVCGFSGQTDKAVKVGDCWIAKSLISGVAKCMGSMTAAWLIEIPAWLARKNNLSDYSVYPSYAKAEYMEWDLSLIASEGKRK